MVEREAEQGHRVVGVRLQSHLDGVVGRADQQHLGWVGRRCGRRGEEDVIEGATGRGRHSEAHDQSVSQRSTAFELTTVLIQFQFGN